MVLLRGGARQRPAVVLATVLAVGWWGTVPAAADVLGSVVVTPLSGTDTTLLRGVVTGASCPAGTDDALFDIVGPDIGVGAVRGQGQIGFLGAASRDGRGDEAFVGASIANLRAVGAGAFATSGSYRVRLRCQRGAAMTSTYETVLDYTAGGAGSFTVRNPRPVPVSATSSGRPRAVAGPPVPVPVVGAAADVRGSAPTAAPGSAAAPAPGGAAPPLPGGAAVAAPGSPAGPSTGGDPAGRSGALAATPGPEGRTAPGIGSIGWLVVAVVGVGALALAGLERRWRALTHGAQPGEARGGQL